MERSRKSLCPSRFCKGGDPVQGLVSRRQAEAAAELALEGAIRCSGCGCVWVKDDGGGAHILGTLREVGRRYEWRSPYKR